MRIIQTDGKSRYLDFAIPDAPSSPPSAETGNLVNTYTTGETIGGQRVVMLKNGLIYYFDPSDEANYNLPLGFSKTSQAVSTPIDVIMAGLVTGMSLSTGTVYYAGAAGVLTSSVPSSGIILRVGQAKSSSVLAISFSQPIILV